MRASLFFLVLCWACVAAVQNETEDSELTEDNVSSNSKSEKLFFGTLSTQSHTIVSYTTSTVFFSCLQGFSTAAGPSTSPCMGKRRRKKRRSQFETTEMESKSRYVLKYIVIVTLP